MYLYCSIDALENKFCLFKHQYLQKIKNQWIDFTKPQLYEFCINDKNSKHESTLN